MMKTSLEKPLPLFVRRVGVTLCLALCGLGCTVSAPPAEDVVGDGLVVEEGHIIVDKTRVPLLTPQQQCANGQVVVKSADEWVCQTPETGTDYTGTNGIGIAANGAISPQYGAGEFEVARGSELAAVTATVTTLANAIVVDENDVVNMGQVAIAGVRFGAQKVCVYDGGAVTVGADWTQARCIEFVAEIGAVNPRFGCMQPDDYDIGDVTDGGASPPGGDDDCGWCPGGACP